MSGSLQSILGAEALAAFDAGGPGGVRASGRRLHERGVPCPRERADLHRVVGLRGLRARARPARRRHAGHRGGAAVPPRARRRARGPGLPQRVCRHRNLKLVDTPGNVGRAIRCPLSLLDLRARRRAPPHSVLRAGGNPRAVPPGFDRGRHGLVPVRSATWHDWIFVNPSGAAPPFEEFVAPLRSRLEGVDPRPGPPTSSPSTSARWPRTGSSSWRTSSSPTHVPVRARDDPPSSRSSTTTP